MKERAEEGRRGGGEKEKQRHTQRERKWSLLVSTPDFVGKSIHPTMEIPPSATALAGFCWSRGLRRLRRTRLG
jgi:hypothetical protein